jgi:rfaE bifunctional protein kinase chain/domain
MNRHRFDEITSQYSRLRLAVLGDFCLDRYLEIDSSIQEVSRETGLSVHNVTRVRAQPGGAGTVVQNLAALRIGEIRPLGFAGDDAEGLELCRALRGLPGVCMDGFLTTPLRRTFTYCKPLMIEAGRPPRELNRLDSKNWTPTPCEIEDQLIDALDHAAQRIDALVVLDQVDVADTGVVTRRMLAAVGRIAAEHPELPILADGRRGLAGFPAVSWKMNRAEIGLLIGQTSLMHIDAVKIAAAELARKNGREVFVTLAEHGLVGASPSGELVHVPALPTRGEIDIVGAGDAVTANLITASAAGAELDESLALANAAASVVIHQLGTTGAASVDQIAEILALDKN